MLLAFGLGCSAPTPDTPFPDTPPPPAVDTVDAGPPIWTNHAAWTIQPAPIWTQYAGDFSVLRDGSSLLAVYTCYDPGHGGGEICMARSADGLTWVNESPHAPLDGRALTVVAGSWHESHETPELVDGASGRLLFFAGYVGTNIFTASSSAFGRAIVTGMAPYPLAPATPVAGAPSGFGLIDSPSIERAGNELRMVYTGFSPDFSHIALLGATSADDGLTWTPLASEVIPTAQLPAYTAKGIAETCLRTGPDGRHYLFFQTIDEPNAIGVAVADEWQGPYTFAPTPLMTSAVDAPWTETRGMLAPHVVFDGDRVRMWFHDTRHIGYAEAAL